MGSSSNARSPASAVQSFGSRRRSKAEPSNSKIATASVGFCHASRCLPDRRTADFLKPVAIGPTKRTTTASGSILAPTTRAQVAKSSRIWVEGVHDAELVEKVWGEDLRGEAIVVEPLHGRTTWSVHCATSARTHSAKLVCCSTTWFYSKESRIATDAVRAFAPNVHVIGHPFIDVWQAVKPEAVGIAAWPTVPPGNRGRPGDQRSRLEL